MACSFSNAIESQYKKSDFLSSDALIKDNIIYKSDFISNRTWSISELITTQLTQISNIQLSPGEYTINDKVKLVVYTDGTIKLYDVNQTTYFTKKKLPSPNKEIDYARITKEIIGE